MLCDSNSGTRQDSLAWQGGEVGDLRTHGDALAAEQCEQLVVIKQGVHALNPQRIHRAVKQNPLLLWAVVLADGTHNAGKHTILPLMGALIK